MAEEIENNENEAVENEAAENAAADSSSSQAAGEESTPAAVDAGDDSAPAEEEAEPEEQLSPKERRKRSKSRKNRRARYKGLTLEERRAERDVIRKRKAVQRRAHRLKQREEHKAAGPREGTPKTEREPGRKRIQQGTVVSSKTDKTITIEIEVQEAHRVYKKVVRHSKKLTAHDERNDANEGDVVRVIESRPLSKTKRWRLVEVVERAR